MCLTPKSAYKSFLRREKAALDEIGIEIFLIVEKINAPTMMCGMFEPPCPTLSGGIKLQSARPEVPRPFRNRWSKTESLQLH